MGKVSEAHVVHGKVVRHCTLAQSSRSPEVNVAWESPTRADDFLVLALQECCVVFASASSVNGLPADLSRERRRTQTTNGYHKQHF